MSGFNTCLGLLPTTDFISENSEIVNVKAYQSLHAFVPCLHHLDITGTNFSYFVTSWDIVRKNSMQRSIRPIKIFIGTFSDGMCISATLKSTPSSFYVNGGFQPDYFIQMAYQLLFLGRHFAACRYMCAMQICCILVINVSRTTQKDFW